MSWGEIIVAIGAPVYYPLFMKVLQARGQLRDPKFDNVLSYAALALEMNCRKVNMADGERNRVDAHRRSPPSIRSRTKKQFSSSWKA